MVTYEQINLFNMLDCKNTEPVMLNDICEFKNGRLNNYEIRFNYSDVVLLISMLHDYIVQLNYLDGCKKEYYKMRFKDIADTLEQGIGYDYANMLEKCRSKVHVKDDRLGENWIGA